PRPPVAPMPPVGPVLPAGGAAEPPTAPGELLGARVPSEGTYVVVGVVGVAAPVDLPASVVDLGVAAPVDRPASVVGVGLVGAACDVSPGRVEVVEAALRSALARPASVVAVELVALPPIAHAVEAASRIASAAATSASAAPPLCARLD